MTKYKVTFDTWYELEADDEDDAVYSAWDMLNSGDFAPDVEEIKGATPHEHKLIDETHDFFLLALGNFTYETPPLDIRTWDMGKADKWVAEHLWQPFEDWDVNDVWEAAADLERQFNAVKDKILQNANTTKELADAEVGV
tara:strand:+ start:339 stop:758 length:420 start_codon:yes stop_codon:yes gene_type:complete